MKINKKKIKLNKEKPKGKEKERIKKEEPKGKEEEQIKKEEKLKAKEEEEIKKEEEAKEEEEKIKKEEEPKEEEKERIKKEEEPEEEEEEIKKEENPKEEEEEIKREEAANGKEEEIKKEEEAKEEEEIKKEEEAEEEEEEQINKEKKPINRDGKQNRKVNPSDPDTILKFRDPLVIPPIARSINSCDNTNRSPYYNIVMREARHKFHRDFPFTKIWGYNGIYPGPTIEATKDSAISVKWTNYLPDKHFLPIDHSLHSTIDLPDVRTVVHVHGANVDPDSDGHPDAWFTKDYSQVGKKFTRKVYEYTNHQPGTTLWYHDHSMGITRLNVYAGLAGFYIIRDSLEKRLNLPRGKYEIPLLIQDKSFNADGSLFYPDRVANNPNAPIPSIVGLFLGNTISVNGKLWPYLNVEPRKYRFRILNGSNGRPYDLSLSNGESFYQIGTDGGFIDHTMEVSGITMEPAERVDVIIDFSKFKGEEITLLNSAFGADENTSVIMKFNVILPLSDADTSEIPEEINHAEPINQTLVKNTRFLPLTQRLDRFNRQMFLLDNKTWADPTTEKPEIDSIEIWNIINTFPFPHPIHVHLVQFKILDRTPFDVAEYRRTGKIVFTGPPEEPLDFERGFKDTVRVDGGMITRIIMHFKDHVGDFVWHCHILEHEDYDMMRPLRVLKD